MDLDLIKGVGPATRKKLEAAGVTSVEDLAKGEKDALADATGIPPGKLDSFITQAQGLVAAESAEPEDEDAPDAGATIPAAKPSNGNGHKPTPPASTTPDWRVVLRDRASTARVSAGDVTYENLPIVTAKLEEDEETIMREISYNAVLLKEQATTASVRVNAEWKTGVPIYKERTLEGSEGVAELTRVRVHEIRERGAATPDPDDAKKERKGFLAKVLGK